MISKIKIYPVNNPKSSVVAFGSFILGEAVQIQCKINKSQKGLFVGLPSHKGKDKEGKDKWFNDVYIVKDGLFEEVNKQVVKAYQDMVGDQDGPPEPDQEPTFQDVW